MLDIAEITPNNVRLLFGSESVPTNTNIIIKGKGKWTTGKVIESRVFPELCRMVIKIDKTNQIFSYPIDRFFLPYISVSRTAVSSKIAVSVTPPTVVCR